MDELPTHQPLLVKIRDPADDASWAEFVALCTPLIFRFCSSRNVPRVDIPDETQETMRRIAKGIQSFDYDPARGKFRS